MSGPGRDLRRRADDVIERVSDVTREPASPRRGSASCSGASPISAAERAPGRGSDVADGLVGPGPGSAGGVARARIDRFGEHSRSITYELSAVAEQRSSSERSRRSSGGRSGIGAVDAERTAARPRETAGRMPGRDLRKVAPPPPRLRPRSGVRCPSERTSVQGAASKRRPGDRELRGPRRRARTHSARLRASMALD